MKRVVPKERRCLFRLTLASEVTRALGGSRSLSSTQLPSPDERVVEEVHSAFLEYNVHRLVGNYRKGLHPSNNCTGSAFDTGSCVPRLRGRAAYVLDYTHFLFCNLENNVAFTCCISGTRMYCHWENAVLSLETVGLLRSLHGEFFLQSNSATSKTHRHAIAAGRRDSCNTLLPFPSSYGWNVVSFLRSQRATFPRVVRRLAGQRSGATE